MFDVWLSLDVIRIVEERNLSALGVVAVQVGLQYSMHSIYVACTVSIIINSDPVGMNGFSCIILIMSQKFTESRCVHHGVPLDANPDDMIFCLDGDGTVVLMIRPQCPVCERIGVPNGNPYVVVSRAPPDDGFERN